MASEMPPAGARPSRMESSDPAAARSSAELERRRRRDAPELLDEGFVLGRDPHHLNETAQERLCLRRAAPEERRRRAREAVRENLCGNQISGAPRHRRGVLP